MLGKSAEWCATKTIHIDPMKLISMSPFVFGYLFTKTNPHSRSIFFLGTQGRAYVRGVHSVIRMIPKAFQTAYRFLVPQQFFPACDLVYFLLVLPLLFTTSLDIPIPPFLGG